MKQWEYLYAIAFDGNSVKLSSFEKKPTPLSQLGKEGWELAGVSQNDMYFKREVTPSPIQNVSKRNPEKSEWEMEF